MVSRTKIKPWVKKVVCSNSVWTREDEPCCVLMTVSMKAFFYLKVFNFWWIKKLQKLSQNLLSWAKRWSLWVNMQCHSTFNVTNASWLIHLLLLYKSLFLTWFEWLMMKLIHFQGGQRRHAAIFCRFIISFHRWTTSQFIHFNAPETTVIAFINSNQ